MATFVNDLRLTELATGEGSGTWGTTTNTNLELIAEAFSFGTEAITTNADTHTTTIADGSTDPGRSLFLKYTGTLDSACTITIGPNTVSKLWLIENATSGGFSIIIKQGSGATITVPNGQTKAIYSDGAGSGAAMVDAFQDLSIPDLFIDDDLTFTSDGAVITFGADGDTTLTHTDGSGLTLNSTNKIMFNDASQFIQGSSATVLSLGATDEIDLTATLIDINGNADVSGTVTATGTSVFASLDISGDIDVDGTTNLDVVDIDGAVDMASTLQVDGAITSSSGATITLADNTDNLSLISTDTDDNSGPNLRMYRFSANPADADVIGQIDFEGRNDNTQDVRYGFISAKISDASDGSEDGQLRFFTIAGGTETQTMTLESGNSTFAGVVTANAGAVINESGADSDFRVESVNNANMLLVDAGNDRIQIANLLLGEISSNVDIIQSTSSSGLLVDVTGNILLDADGGEVSLRDGGTEFGQFAKSGNDFRINQAIQDGDIVFRGNDGGSIITALTIDMSAAGAATFNAGAVINESGADSDFRVESDNKANMFGVNAGSDFVYVGTDEASQGGALNVNAVSGSAVASLFSRSATDGHTGILNFMKTPATSGNYTATASGDVLGDIRFTGVNTSAVADIGAQITATQNGTSSSTVPTNLVFNANEKQCLAMDGSNVVVNDDSADMDFRVESDGSSHMLFVDAGNDRVGVGVASPTNTFDLQSSSQNAARIRGNGNIELYSYGDSGGVGWATGENTSYGELLYLNESDSKIQFYANQLAIGDFGSSEVNFNDRSGDQDFRVESDGNANMLFVDASTNEIGMGRTPSSCQLDVQGGSSGTITGLRIRNSGQAAGSAIKQVFSLNRDGSDIDYEAASITVRKDQNWTTGATTIDASMAFNVIENASSTEKMRLLSAGHLVLGDNGDPTFENAAKVVLSYGGAASFIVTNDSALINCRQASDGNLIQFYGLTNGATNTGNISQSGGTVTYGAFMANHPSEFAGTETEILIGTVMETTGAVSDIASIEGARLPATAISTTEDSNAVYGVYLGTNLAGTADGESEEAGIKVASIGAYFVRVHQSETPQLGDLLSSKGDGTAKVQSDDVIRSRTIGKVVGTVKKQTYDDGSYLLPCVLYCG